MFKNCSHLLMIFFIISIFLISDSTSIFQKQLNASEKELWTESTLSPAVEEAWWRAAERGLGEEALRNGDVFNSFTEWARYVGLVPPPSIQGHEPDETPIGSFPSGGNSPLNLTPARDGSGVFMVHEVDGLARIYKAVYTCPNPPGGIVIPFLDYAGSNGIGQDDGLVELPSGNFLITDFNGDLSTNDDNILEVDTTGALVKHWDVDKANCACAGHPNGNTNVPQMSINQILGIACSSCDGIFPETVWVESNAEGAGTASTGLIQVELLDTPDTMHAAPQAYQWRVLSQIPRGGNYSFISEVYYPDTASGETTVYWTQSVGLNRYQGLTGGDNPAICFVGSPENAPDNSASGIAAIGLDGNGMTRCEIWSTGFSSDNIFRVQQRGCGITTSECGEECVYPPSLSHDAGAVSIDTPGFQILPNTSIIPRATFENVGLFVENFDVAFLIEEEGTPVYGDTQNVPRLSVGDSIRVVFSNWTSGNAGTLYDLMVRILLPGDLNPLNDSKTGLTEAICSPEFTYDDGIMEWIVPPPSSPIAYMGVRFSIPPTFLLPFEIVRAWLYLSSTDTLEEVLVCPGDITGLPGYLSPYETVPNVAAPIANSWSVVEFPTPDSINSYDDIWVLVRWSAFDTLPAFGIDNTPPTDYRSYISDAPPIWNLYVGGDFMVRLSLCPSGLTGEEEVELTPSISKIFHLSQNHPNPFSTTTLIHYEIPMTNDKYQMTNILLAVYDLTGRLVETLVNEFQDPGVYQLPITNHQLPGSGVYFYRITIGYPESALGGSGQDWQQQRQRTITKKMVLMK